MLASILTLFLLNITTIFLYFGFIKRYIATEVVGMEEETLALGGNISLTGFREIDRAQMVVLKKIVGTYGKKYSEICNKFESLHVTMKPVHETEKSKIFEIHAKCMDNGKPITSTSTDRNLFVAISDALRKLESEITK